MKKTKEIRKYAEDDDASIAEIEKIYDLSAFANKFKHFVYDPSKNKRTPEEIAAFWDKVITPTYWDYRFLDNIDDDTYFFLIVVYDSHYCNYTIEITYMYNILRKLPNLKCKVITHINDFDETFNTVREDAFSNYKTSTNRILVYYDAYQEDILSLRFYKHFQYLYNTNVQVYALSDKWLLFPLDIRINLLYFPTVNFVVEWVDIIPISEKVHLDTEGFFYNLNNKRVKIVTVGLLPNPKKNICSIIIHKGYSLICVEIKKKEKEPKKEQEQVKEHNKEQQQVPEKDQHQVKEQDQQKDQQQDPQQDLQQDPQQDQQQDPQQDQ